MLSTRRKGTPKLTSLAFCPLGGSLFSYHMAVEGTPELTSWGDSDMPFHKPSIFSRNVALVLTWSGVILVQVPLLLRRTCVCTLLWTLVTSKDIIEGFDAAGLDVNNISSIRRKNLNNTWVVSFNVADCKERTLALSSLQITGCSVVLGDSVNTTVIVKIYEAPDEMADTMIFGRLSVYGTVLSFHRYRISSMISNGICTARVHLKKSIPSAAYIAGEVMYFFNASQLHTCRRCGLEGHMAWSCSAVRHHSSKGEKPTCVFFCLEQKRA